MKDNENKRVSILVDDDQNNRENRSGDDIQGRAEKLKKPVIFILMALVFVGCMYLIFKPSSNKKKVEDIGLNGAVPQASDAGMQSDKQKAYEQEMFDQKIQEKRNELTSLSDYWNDNNAGYKNEQLPAERYQGTNSLETIPAGSNALNSYRRAQNTLGSFYDNHDYQAQELRRQVEELKEKLAAKNIPATTNLQDQMALMEKSYQMAAKYLPSNAPSKQEKIEYTTPTSTSMQKEHFALFTPLKKNAVSALYREPSDSTFLESWNENRNKGFYTTGINRRVQQSKNSIRAIVEETQTITDESSVRLRLLEDAKMSNHTVAIGTVLTAKAKFQNGRLQLKVTSIEFEGNITPVDITVYDLDGQQGLYVPFSSEMNALTEIASNMGQSSGTSIMMTRSAGQQSAGDLSRGVVQGISGYFSKKIRTPKVSIKAGHQLFLISKN